MLWSSRVHNISRWNGHHYKADGDLAHLYFGNFLELTTEVAKHYDGKILIIAQLAKLIYDR